MRDGEISFPYPLLYLRELRCRRMKKICRAGILVAVVIVFAGLVCMQYRDQNPQRYEGQFFDCFDTVTMITGYADSQQDFSEKLELLQAKLVYYHQLYDIYHTYDGVNNLKTINDNAGVEAVKVDAEIFDLLKFGKEMYDKTEGRLHIAYGSVLSLHRLSCRRADVFGCGEYRQGVCRTKTCSVCQRNWPETCVDFRRWKCMCSRGAGRWDALACRDRKSAA